MHNECVSQPADGTVDVALGVILSMDGVTRVRFPRLAHTAERVGYQLLSRWASLTRRSYLFTAAQPDSQPRWQPEPATARKVGAGVLLAASSFVTVTSAPHIMHAGQGAVTHIQEFVHDTFTEPLITFRRP